MLNLSLYTSQIDIFDPYNMLPIEKTVTYLGEMR
jgi:hypothetical protein